ncbi:ricin-type beta-trefoil lectin domain protein [Leucobacter viscericola]|uniref:Ricin-type beta-trefoil lectin domain protein n=1 Tax=Leucobacter viscericola TaxID=2714935 RepID=A0A6G7XGY0_9MICO|nr:ricin-type beta-trefoil lectin domain protein [Leucobacter viscericola]QIK63860.1 ricin-type beta-trefoil lectin domain protein [Leucobacter viscericola]
MADNMLMQHARQLSRRTKVTAAVVGIVSFLLALGAPPAVAAWSATATSTGSASAPTIAITQSGFDSLSTTFQRHTTDQRGGFTLTNTGGGTGNAYFIAKSTSTGASKVGVRVWPTASMDECLNGVMPETAQFGTWAAFPTIAGTSLAPGASVIYCVRSLATDADGLATASGTQSLVATAYSQIRAGTWLAGTGNSQATMTTKAFYPLGMPARAANQNNWMMVKPVSDPNQCLDIYYSRSQAGTALQTFGCGAQSNQRFEIVTTPGGQSTLRPRTSPEMSIGQTGNRGVLAAAGDSSANWRIETVTSTTFQLVHGDTGLCLTANTSAQTTLTPCSGANTQKFTMTRDPVSCSVSASNIYLAFKAPPGVRTYTVQIQVGGQWTDVYTNPDMAQSTFTMTRSMFPAGDATIGIRVVDSVGNVLYSGLSIGTFGANMACGTNFNG